jgi:hypothetical protein
MYINNAIPIKIPIAYFEETEKKILNSYRLSREPKKPRLIFKKYKQNKKERFN